MHVSDLIGCLKCAVERLREKDDYAGVKPVYVVDDNGTISVVNRFEEVEGALFLRTITHPKFKVKA